MHYFYGDFPQLCSIARGSVAPNLAIGKMRPCQPVAPQAHPIAGMDWLPSWQRGTAGALESLMGLQRLPPKGDPPSDSKYIYIYIIYIYHYIYIISLSVVEEVVKKTFINPCSSWGVCFGKELAESLWRMKPITTSGWLTDGSISPVTTEAFCQWEIKNDVKPAINSLIPRS